MPIVSNQKELAHSSDNAERVRLVTGRAPTTLNVDHKLEVFEVRMRKRHCGGQTEIQPQQVGYAISDQRSRRKFA
jgi:hypothetical protein